MTWISNNLTLIIDMLGEHAVISFPAIALSIALSIPIGWIAAKHRRFGAPLVSGLELLYAIPSLALFVLIPALIGVGLRSYANIIIVLTIYGVAVLVRSCVEAFESVPEEVQRAADSCGFTRWKRFWAVDLPLSLPVCIAGIRVMAVSTISLVTVGSVIGIQSLGTLFTDGFQRGIMEEVAMGLILTVVFALVVDGLIVLAGKLLMPWTRRSRCS